MIALEGASNRLTSTWQFSREYRSCPSPFSLGRIQTSSQVGRPRASLKQNRAVKRPISSSFSSQSLHPLPFTRFFISLILNGICTRVYINSSCCAAVFYASTFRINERKTRSNFVPSLSRIPRNAAGLYVINFKLDGPRCSRSS